MSLVSRCARSEDMEGPYRSEDLSRFVFPLGHAHEAHVRGSTRNQGVSLVLAEGEGGKTLQTRQLIVSEKLADVTLVGRHKVIIDKIKSMGLSIKADKDFDIIDNLDDVVITPIGEEYHTLTARQGMTPKAAQTRVQHKHHSARLNAASSR